MLGPGRTTRTRLGVVQRRAAAYEHLGRIVVLRREREEHAGAGHGVRDAHAVREAREALLRVLFPVVDRRVAVCGDEDAPVG
jgi:hypothetical protein